MYISHCDYMHKTPLLLHTDTVRHFSTTDDIIVLIDGHIGLIVPYNC